MSDTPSSCPFCGSYVALLDCGQPCGDSEGNWVAFRCLTSWHRGYHDLRKLQSKTCETVERHKLYDRIKRLEEFARTIERDFDHDEDAHRYGTTCRVCDAEDLLKENKAKEDKP